MRNKILEALKTKYQNLGLDAKVFEGVADMLATTNLVNDENFESIITGAESSLKGLQSEIDRRTNTIKAELEDYKKKTQTTGEPKEPEKPKEESLEKFMEEYKRKMVEMENKIITMTNSKLADDRKRILEKTLNGASTVLKDSVLKSYGHMKFEQEEDFNTYVQSLEEDVKKDKQEQVNRGLNSQSPLFSKSSDSSGVSDSVKKYVEQKNNQNARD